MEHLLIVTACEIQRGINESKSFKTVGQHTGFTLT